MTCFTQVRIWERCQAARGTWLTRAHTRTLNSPVFLNVQSYFLEGGGEESMFLWRCSADSTSLSHVNRQRWWDAGKSLAQALPHPSASLYWSCLLHQRKLDGAGGGKERVGHTQPGGVFAWQSITATRSDKDTTWEISPLCCSDCWMLYGREQPKEGGFINW